MTLLEVPIITAVIGEGGSGGAHTYLAQTAENLKAALLKHLAEVQALPTAERLKKRYEKFRAHGHFTEKANDAAQMKPPRNAETAVTA